ncbi:PilW family protein [Candidatus Palauibacter sp.]|uniref:PilW family protein n=1 Tax=Candidatus Palauibacter sp. TaxID=3101350 RepID=UPI003B525AA4
MSRPRRRRVVARRRTVGFTLTEVLVALVGAGLLGGVLMALVVSQSRFHLRNEDAVQAAQTTRALFDGMGAEIRGAAPDDLLSATPDTVSIRLPVLRAVVCDSVGPGTADIFVYDSVPATNLRSPWRGTALSEPYGAAFRYEDGFTIASAMSAVAESLCRAAGADRAGLALPRWFRRTSGWAGRFGATPRRGALARIYGRLTYSIRSASTEPGAVAVRRNGQEFATPLAPGAAFEYEMDDGSTRARVVPADLAQVREVRLVAEAIGRNRLGDVRRIVYEMPFRN